MWEVGCSLASLGGGGGLRHVLAPCLWLRRKPSITSVPLNAAVPQCTVSDFNTWSILSPALTQTSIPSYGPPTLFVSFGALYCFLCKPRVNWMFCVAGKGKRLLVTDSSWRQSSWSIDWPRQSFAIMGIQLLNGSVLFQVSQHWDFLRQCASANTTCLNAVVLLFQSKTPTVQHNIQWKIFILILMQ